MTKIVDIRKLPFAFVIVFMLLLTAKDYLGLSIPGNLFTLLWILIILFANKDVSTAFTLASVICFASTLSITIPCVLYFGLFIINHRKIRATPVLFVSLYVLIIEFMRLVGDSGESFNLYVNSMSVLLLVYTVITTISEKEVNPVTCIKFYLWFFAFLSLDIVFATAKTLGSFNSIITGSFRIGQIALIDENASGVFSINANGIALMSILAISLTMLLFVKGYLSRVPMIAFLIYYSIVGLLTVSKTFILVYVGFWCLYILWYTVTNNRNIFKTLALIIVALIVVYLMWDTNMVQNVIARFDTNDITTGRVDVAAEYIEYMNRHRIDSIIGIGLQNVTGKTSLIHVPHNAVLEIFVCFGWIGVLAYFAYFTFMFFSGVHLQRQNSDSIWVAGINFIPLFIFLVFIQGLQFLRITYIYSSIVLVFAAMYIKKC